MRWYWRNMPQVTDQLLGSAPLEVGTGFHPELTGRENIFLNGSLLGMLNFEIKKRFDEIVEFSGVSKFLDTPVKFYSSGMYTRLAFSVAAHLNPEILIVDEVLAVGDAEFQKKCLGKMNSIAQSGRTVIFVSHNMHAVKNLCKTCIFLKNGTIHDAGEINKVITTYANEIKNQEESNVSLSCFRQSGIKPEAIPVKFESIEAERESLIYNKDFVFYLKVSADAEYNNISIGASIFNQFDDCIATLFTHPQIILKKNEVNQLKLTIPHFGLAPGEYYMGFSIGTGGLYEERHDFDLITGFPHFNIPRLVNNSFLSANWNTAWGNLIIEKATTESL